MSHASSRPALLVALTAAVAFLVAAGSVAADPTLVEAAKRRDVDAVRALLKHKADVNLPQADGATALHWAAHWDDLTIADLLLHAGARPDSANEYGVTPLMLAATNGSVPMIDQLLKA